MNLLRATKACRTFTLLAGIAFLNLSFILAEISALGLTKKYKSLVQMVTNAGLEEEKEAGGAETGESDIAGVDLMEENLAHHKILFLSAEQRNKVLQNQSIHPGHADIFSPPPDRLIHLS
jgi:hypothetical protein